MWVFGLWLEERKRKGKIRQGKLLDVAGEREGRETFGFLESL